MLLLDDLPAARELPKGRFVHCRLVRKGRERTGWLPEDLVKAGDTVTIWDRGRWSSGWLVTSIREPYSAQLQIFTDEEVRKL